MFDHVVLKVRHAATGAALGTLGLVLILIGLGFLTAALWILLAAWQSSLFAATVIGAGFVGIGLVVLGLVAARRPPPPPVPQAANVGAIIAAFTAGIEAGKAMRR